MIIVTLVEFSQSGIDGTIVFRVSLVYSIFKGSTLFCHQWYHNMVILKFKSYCRERVLPEIHDNKEVPVELYGQFHVQLGQLDRVYTIWRHSGGYSDVDKTLLQLNNMTSYQKFVEDQGKLVRKREQQLCYEFAFWPTYDDYYDGGLFEIRSYTLKVVTIVYCVSGSSVL